MAGAPKNIWANLNFGQNASIDDLLSLSINPSTDVVNFEVRGYSASQVSDIVKITDGLGNNIWKITGSSIIEVYKDTRSYANYIHSGHTTRIISGTYIRPYLSEPAISGLAAKQVYVGVANDIAEKRQLDYTDITGLGYIATLGDGDKGDITVSASGTLWSIDENDYSLGAFWLWKGAVNDSGSTIAKGTPVYITGNNGDKINIAPADASNPAKMPAVGIVREQIANGAEGIVVIGGTAKLIDVSGGIVGQTLYVASGVGFTTTKPTYPNLVQNIGKITKDGNNGNILVFGPGRTNDVPNLASGHVFIGGATGNYDTRRIVASDVDGLGPFATLTDGDRGDITTSVSGTVWTVDNSAITYAKIQNVSSTDRILGRYSSGSGIIEEITCTAAGRALLDDNSAADQRATLLLSEQDNVTFAGVTIVENGLNETPLTIRGYSLVASGSVPMIALSGSWNTGGAPTAIDLNILDTASSSSSRLLNLRVNNSSKLSLNKSGELNIAQGITTNERGSLWGRILIEPGGARVANSLPLSFSSTTLIGGFSGNDPAFIYDGIHTIAQRASTNAQNFRIYNTYTDASNYERGKFGWTANTLEIGTEAAGTGVRRSITLLGNTAISGVLTLPDNTIAIRNTQRNAGIIFVDGFVGLRDHTGNTCLGAREATVNIPSAINLGFGSSSIAGDSNNIIKWESAGVLGQRGWVGTNAQTYRIYNTYTNDNNYERARVGWLSGVLYIGTENIGSGIARDFSLQRGGVTVFGANQNHLFTANGYGIDINPGNNNTPLVARSANSTDGGVRSISLTPYNGRVAFNNSTNTFMAGLNCDGPAVLSQRDTTVAQTFRVYNTFTDLSNYERGKFGWNSNVLEIGAEAAGTGIVRKVAIVGDKVGIGTTNPEAKLDVISTDAGVPGIIRMRNTNSTAVVSGWEFAVGAPGNYDGYLMVRRTGQPTPGDFYFDTGGTPTFNNDIALADNKTIKSASSGALAYYQIYRAASGSNAVISWRNHTAGTPSLFTFNAYHNNGSSWGAQEVMHLVANSHTDRRVGIGTSVPSGMLHIAGYALSGTEASSSLYIDQTWNTTGTPTAIFANITDTASNANSALMNLRTNGVDRFQILKGSNRIRIQGSSIKFLHPTNDGFNCEIKYNTNDNITLHTYNQFCIGFAQQDFAPNVQLHSSKSFGWSDTTTLSAAGDLRLWRDDSAILAQRDAAKSQTYRIYGTYTDASNYTRLAIGHNGTSAFISEQAAGTGVAGGIAVSAASLGGSQATSLLDLTQTWNTTGTPTAIKLNITDTASNAASRLLDLQVGAASKFIVRKDGIIQFGAPNVYGIDQQNGRWDFKYIGVQTGVRLMWDGTVRLGTGGNITWANAGGADVGVDDLSIVRDGPNILAQRRATNAQTSRIYGTYTDASNYTRLALGHNGTSAFINEEVAGTGVAGGIAVSAAGLSGVQATSLLDITQTWNTTGTPTALKLNITDTASNSASLLMDLRVGGTTQCKVAKNGQLTANRLTSAAIIENAAGFYSDNSSVRTQSAGYFGFSSTGSPFGAADILLYRDGAGILAQRNTTNTQALRVYRTWTDASNYEALELAHATYSGAQYSILRTITAGTGSDNIGLVLSQSGTGSITAALPDGAGTGGNARGNNAVDLQTDRLGIADRVASGRASFVVGRGNQATGDYAVGLGYDSKGNAIYALAQGLSSAATATLSFARGHYASAYMYGGYTQATGRFAATGDAQVTTLVMRQATTDAIPTELFLDGTAVRITLLNNTRYFVTVKALATTDSATGEWASFQRSCLISRTSSAATTALTGAVQTIGSDIGTNKGSPPDGWDFTLGADTANGSLKVEATGVVSRTIRWLAYVTLVEIGFA